MWLKAQHFSKRDPVSSLLVTLISNPRDFHSLFLSSSIVDDALWSGGDVFLQARPAPGTCVEASVWFQSAAGLGSCAVVFTCR